MESIGSYKTQDVHSLEATELRLGLPGTDVPQKAAPVVGARGNKRALEDDDTAATMSSCTEESTCRETAPPAKAQVVGWPPVQSFRTRNTLQARKAAEAEGSAAASCSGILVKVSMDGAPYLRKIDLAMYKGYKELRQALDAMFKCFSVRSSDLTITYEDKDGDWMLVGDVPWEMFISSCKRLRIMKGSEARQ